MKQTGRKVIVDQLSEGHGQIGPDPTDLEDWVLGREWVQNYEWSYGKSSSVFKKVGCHNERHADSIAYAPRNMYRCFGENLRV